MRAAPLICLAILAGACTTDGTSSPTTSSTTSQVTTATTESVAPPDTEPNQTTTTGETAESVQVGDEIRGQGTLGATVQAVLPHDFKAHTQGLAWDGLGLIESTGVYGSSQRRFLSPTSARTSQEKDLAPELFATDLVVFDGNGIQLSAREGIATVFGAEDLNPTGKHRFEGEGWGICFSDDGLVLSNNSNTVTLRDAATFEATDTREIGDESAKLRALECTDGLLWAVLGDTDTVAAINFDSGQVVGSLDLTQLIPSTAGPNDRLTSIAYSPQSDTFFFAGRRWGVVYELAVETPG